jgi:hypothetical protein
MDGRLNKKNMEFVLKYIEAQSIRFLDTKEAKELTLTTSKIKPTVGNSGKTHFWESNSSILCSPTQVNQSVIKWMPIYCLFVSSRTSFFQGAFKSILSLLNSSDRSLLWVIECIKNRFAMGT